MIHQQQQHQQQHHHQQQQQVINTFVYGIPFIDVERLGQTVALVYLRTQQSLELWSCAHQVLHLLFLVHLLRFQSTIAFHARLSMSYVCAPTQCWHSLASSELTHSGNDQVSVSAKACTCIGKGMIKNMGGSGNIAKVRPAINILLWVSHGRQTQESDKAEQLSEKNKNQIPAFWVDVS